MVWMSWAPSQAIAAGLQDAKLMEVADEVLAPVAGTDYRYRGVRGEGWNSWELGVRCQVS